MHQLVGGHAGVAYEDQAGLRILPDELLQALRFPVALGILKYPAVDRVVEVVDVQVLELATGIVEEGLDDGHIGIHGPAAVVDHEDDLEAVFEAAVEDDVDLPAVAYRLVDGLVDVHHVPGARRGHPAQFLQGLADLTLRQGAFLGVVPVAPLHGHLDGRLVPRAPAHPHPSRVVPGVAHRRRPLRADPPVASVVGLRLLLEAVEEVPDQLLRRHLRQLLLFDAQGRRDVLGALQPLLQEGPGHLGQLLVLRLLQDHSAEMVGEHLVIGVEVPLALHQNRPGGGVEVLHGADEPHPQRLLEFQKGRGLYGNTPVTEGIEEFNEHVLLPMRASGAAGLRSPGPGSS